MTVHVLLADPDAERLAERLGRPDVELTPVATAAAARAYLSGSVFDAVAVQERLDDGLSALAAGLGVPRVFTFDTADALERWVDASFGQKGGIATAVRAAADPATGSVQEELAALRDEIGRVAHDLANPLAVVAGTAQLGREMATDAETAEAFADIEAAAGVLAGRLADLAALRLRLDGLIG